MARIITKGLIGAQDIHFGTVALTRSTSTGGTQTLSPVCGFGQLAAFSDDTGRSADATLNLFNSGTGGIFRISVNIVVTQAATSSSTLPSLSVVWTDADSSQSLSLQLTPTDTGNLLTTVHSGTAIIYPLANSTVQLSISGYASSGATPMKFSLHIRAEGPA